MTSINLFVWLTTLHICLNLCVRVWETFSCLFSCSYLFQYIYWYFELKENCQCFSWMQERAHQYYRAKHHHGASQQWSNFTFYRMENIRFFHLAYVECTINICVFWCAWVEIFEHTRSLVRKQLIHCSRMTSYCGWKLAWTSNCGAG